MKPESCWWDYAKHKLEGNVGSKVREYLRDRLIRPDKERDWIFYVDPSPGRHQTHTIDTNAWICSCQKQIDCSHQLAVRLFMSQVQSGGRGINEGWDRYDQENQEEEKSEQKKTITFGTTG